MFFSLKKIILFLKIKGSRIDEQGFIFDNLQVNGYVFSKNEKFQILIGGLFFVFCFGSLKNK